MDYEFHSFVDTDMKFQIETFDITFTFSDYEPPIKVPFFSSDNGLLFTFRKTVELIITGDITTPTKVIEPWLKKNVEYANCIVNPQMSTDFVQRYENEYISKEKTVKRRLYIGSAEKKNKYTIVTKSEYEYILAQYIECVKPHMHTSNGNAKQFSLMELSAALRCIDNQVNMYTSGGRCSCNIECCQVFVEKYTHLTLSNGDIRDYDPRFSSMNWNSKTNLISDYIQKPIPVDHGKRVKPLKYTQTPDEKEKDKQERLKTRQEIYKNEMDEFVILMGNIEYWDPKGEYRDTFKEHVMEEEDHDYPPNKVRYLKKLSKENMSRENGSIMDSFSSQRTRSGIDTSCVTGNGRGVEHSTQRSTLTHIYQFLYFISVCTPINFMKHSIRDVCTAMNDGNVCSTHIVNAFSWFVLEFTKHKNNTVEKIGVHISMFLKFVNSQDHNRSLTECIHTMSRQASMVVMQHCSPSSKPDIQFDTDIQMMFHNSFTIMSHVLNGTYEQEKKFYIIRQHLLVQFISLYPTLRVAHIRNMCMIHSSNLEDNPPTLIVDECDKWYLDLSHAITNVNARGKTWKHRFSKDVTMNAILLMDCTSKILHLLITEYEHLLESQSGYIFGKPNQRIISNNEEYDLPSDKMFYVFSSHTICDYVPSHLKVSDRHPFTLRDVRTFYNTTREKDRLDPELRTIQSMANDIQKQSALMMGHSKRMQQTHYMNTSDVQNTLIYTMHIHSLFDPSSYHDKGCKAFDDHGLTHETHYPPDPKKRQKKTHSALPSPNTAPATPSTPSTPATPDARDTYTIERFVEKGTRRNKHRDKWKVKWHGYSESECTWEPIRNLKNDLGLDAYNAFIQDFENRA